MPRHAATRLPRPRAACRGPQYDSSESRRAPQWSRRVLTRSRHAPARSAFTGTRSPRRERRTGRLFSPGPVDHRVLPSPGPMERRFALVYPTLLLSSRRAGHASGDQPRRAARSHRRSLGSAPRTRTTFVSILAVDRLNANSGCTGPPGCRLGPPPRFGWPANRISSHGQFEPAS